MRYVSLSMQYISRLYCAIGRASGRKSYRMRTLRPERAPSSTTPNLTPRRVCQKPNPSPIVSRASEASCIRDAMNSVPTPSFQCARLQRDTFAREAVGQPKLRSDRCSPVCNIGCIYYPNDKHIGSRNAPISAPARPRAGFNSLPNCYCGDLALLFHVIKCNPT